VEELIRRVKRNDPRVSTGQIKVSEYAVQCTRCGLVALSRDEGYILEYSGKCERACPLCGGTARSDKGAALTWNHEVKKIICADLLF
jgi:hypothetical protein